jgi:O-antigen/teichoic acid export membrane protein
VLRKSVGIALVDQAVLSLFNLGLNLMLIALAAPSEFGRYIYAASVMLVFTSLQNALVTTPLAVLIPGRSDREQADVLQGLLSFDVPFRIVCAIAAPVLCLLTDYSAEFLFIVAVSTFSVLGRETWRSVALAFENPAECLRIDAMSVAASVLATAVFWFVLAPASACLAGLAVGNLVGAMLVGTARAPQRLPVRQALVDYRARFWNDTQWSLLGAGTTEIQYRSYVFVLEWFRTTATLAAVQAGRLLLGPLTLVVGAWGKVARPAMARKLAAGDTRGMMRITAAGMVYVLSVGVLYCLMLYLLWPLAERFIFKGRYPEVGLLTVAWAGYMMVVIAHMVLSVPLQAAMKLKELAQVTIVTAVVTVLALLCLALPVPSVFAVIAMTIGEVIALVWILVLVVRLSVDGPVVVPVPDLPDLPRDARIAMPAP